jgi:hypothetical protein
VLKHNLLDLQCLRLLILLPLLLLCLLLQVG